MNSPVSMVSFLHGLNSLYSPQVQPSPLSSVFNLNRSSISPAPHSHLPHPFYCLWSLSVPVALSPLYNSSLFPPLTLELCQALGLPVIPTSCWAWLAVQNRVWIQSVPKTPQIPCTKISFLWMEGNWLCFPFLHLFHVRPWLRNALWPGE